MCVISVRGPTPCCQAGYATIHCPSLTTIPLPYCSPCPHGVLNIPPLLDQSLAHSPHLPCALARPQKSSLAVTALGIDAEAKVWTGHQKGTIRVRKKQVGVTLCVLCGPHHGTQRAHAVACYDVRLRFWTGMR